MELKQKLYCPVCPIEEDNDLGERHHYEFFTAHCKDCKATYTWWPRKNRPKASLDKDKKNKCGCASCRR